MTYRRGLALSLLVLLVAAARPPTLDRHPPPSTYTSTVVTSVPHYDPKSDDSFQVDLRGRNLATLDLRAAGADLAFASFDSGTKWPARDKMPASFDPDRVLELGKSPGLGVRAVHARGITGKGVSIAIVDQPLLLEHEDYGDRLRSYEEIAIRPQMEAQMHGGAVSSFSVGKRAGVAPDADLYYVAGFTFDFDEALQKTTENLGHFAAGVRRVVEINAGLPAERKIRVLAIQRGWSGKEKGGAELEAAVKAAMAAGIFVVSSSIERHYRLAFHGLGRSPDADPEAFQSYEPGAWWADEFWREPEVSTRLLVPMDSRTSASPTGAHDFVFYRQGGWSWSIPYIAGAYALAAQVDPTITPERFWKLALATGRTVEIKRGAQTKKLGPILDMQALIAALID